MARVFIDPQAFGKDWFPEALEEMISSKRVRFLFSTTEKGKREIEAVSQALELRKLMADLGRVDQADPASAEARSATLEANATFATCGDCDDPHIMAAIFLHPTKYVFSGDKRLAGCRNKLTGEVNKKYLAFVVIAERPTYDVHRTAILR